MYNIEALNFVLEIIEQNEDQWHQSAWATLLPPSPEDGREECGAAFCFAGWVTIMDILGGRNVQWVDHFNGGTIVLSEDENGDVRGKHILEYAQDRLGLNFEESEFLFAGERKLYEIQDFVMACRTQDRRAVASVMDSVYNGYCNDESCPHCGYGD